MRDKFICSAEYSVPIKQAIKESGQTLKKWAASQGITQKTVSEMVKAGYTVDDEGRVIRPPKVTKYMVQK